MFRLVLLVLYFASFSNSPDGGGGWDPFGNPPTNDGGGGWDPFG